MEKTEWDRQTKSLQHKSYKVGIFVIPGLEMQEQRLKAVSLLPWKLNLKSVLTAEPGTQLSNHTITQIVMEYW